MTTRLPLERNAVSGHGDIAIGERSLTLFSSNHMDEPWRVALDGVAVVDLATEKRAAVGRTPAVYVKEATLPYFRTTSVYTEPTTLVLFDRPRRPGPIKPYMAKQLGLPKAEANNPAVDGFIVTLHDPAGGIEAMQAAGVTVVAHRDDWLATRRPVVTGEAGAALASQRRRYRRTLSWLLSGVLLLLAVSRLAIALQAKRDGTVPGWELLALVAVVVVAGPVLWVLGRRARR